MPEADVEVEILAQEIQLGEDFDLELQFTNHSSQKRVVDIYISGNVVYYTGVPSAEVIFKTLVVSLKPQQSECGDLFDFYFIALTLNTLQFLHLIHTDPDAYHG